VVGKKEGCKNHTKKHWTRVWSKKLQNGGGQGRLLVDCDMGRGGGELRVPVKFTPRPSRQKGKKEMGSPWGVIAKNFGNQKESDGNEKEKEREARIVPGRRTRVSGLIIRKGKGHRSS